MVKIADRVEESTTSTGTGTITLAGAATGYRAFGAAFAVGDLVYYAIQAGAEWEIGVGMVGSGTLTRDTVLASSNANLKVSFSAGTKRVFCTAPAGAIEQHPSGPRIIALLGQSNMMGAGGIAADAAIEPADPFVMQWPMYTSHAKYGQIIQEGTAGLSYPDGAAYSNCTPGGWMARHHGRAVGAPIILVPAAVGSTGLHSSRWMPSLTPGAGGDLFEAAVTQTNAAIAYARVYNPGARFDGFCWCQGEQDGTGVTKSQYAADLTALIAAIRARVTDAASSWAVILSMPYETMQAPIWAGTQPIHYAQIEVAAATPRCKFVPSSRGDTIDPGVNRHRTPAGVRKAGGAMAYAIPLAAAKLAAEALPSPVQVTGLASASITSSGFTLSWTAAPGADTYTVEQSANGGSTWAAVTRVWGDATSMAITGLTDSTTYLFRVTGVWTGTNGTVSSNLSVTTLAAGAVAPSFTTQPTSQSTTAGITATFTSVAAGSPTPTYQWQRNPGGAGSFADISGATSASYTTPATTVSGGSANDTDTYRCVATNASGSATSSVATLTVGASAVAPSFTTQPSAQSVAAGATATFTVVATGTPTPTYQWQRNPLGSGSFADISGATSASYTTPATTVSGGSANNTDTYRCVATNSAGSTNSNAVALTVAASGNVVYDFESDTVGSLPANTVAVSGTWVVVAAGTPSGFGKTARASVASGSGGTGLTLSNASHTALGPNQRVTWRRGASPTGSGRDGVLLRAQSAASVFANAKRGYWFAYNAVSSVVDIYRLDAASTSIGQGGSLPDLADRYFRATANGTSLLFETSPDGTTWTTKVNITDSTYATAAAPCQLFAIAGETGVYYDALTFEALP